MRTFDKTLDHLHVGDVHQRFTSRPMVNNGLGQLILGNEGRVLQNARDKVQWTISEQAGMLVGRKNEAGGPLALQPLSFLSAHFCRFSPGRTD